MVESWTTWMPGQNHSMHIIKIPLGEPGYESAFVYYDKESRLYWLVQWDEGKQTSLDRQGRPLDPETIVLVLDKKSK